jgi:voltage-gated potassium channel
MFVMLLGASMYAFIIGKIASLFTKIDSAKVSYWNRVEAVIQYLRYRNVPRELNSRVRNYYEYMWAEHRGLEENESFNDLPGPLRVEILLHLAKELLNKVPMFKYAAPALRDALLLALKLQTYSPEDHIMREGEVGKEILFLSKGEVEISSQEGTKIHGALGGGDYFGHISLILRERRTASVKAKTYCEIFMLTNDDFKLIKNDYPEFTDVMKRLSSEKPDKISALVLERIIL